MEKDLKKYKEYLDKIVESFNKKPLFIDCMGILYDFLQDSSFWACLLPKNSTVEENIELLSDDVIINEARNIISLIDNDIANKFDETIENHKLILVNDEKKVCETGCFPTKNGLIILVNKEGGYRDVISVIHEFLHFYNYADTDLYRLFTEYFSVYFEMFAVNYLNNVKGISMEEINNNSRILNDSHHIINAKNFITSFYLYNKCKSFNIDEYAKMFPGFDEEYFDELYKYNMKRFEKIEKDYPVTNISLSEMMFRSIMYSLGLILDICSINCRSKEDVLKFYKELNNPENEELSFAELLNKYGFLFTSEEINDSWQKTLVHMKPFGDDNKIEKKNFL